MASTDNRPAFRLPWLSGVPSEPGAGPSAVKAVADPPAWPSHDLARRQTRSGTATPAGPETPTGNGSAPDGGRPVEGIAPVESGPASEEPAAHDAAATDTTGAPAPEVATPEAMPPAARVSTPRPADARDRKPTKFLADLTRAMRHAADEARAAALTQFQADVDAHTTQAQEARDSAANSARQRADTDIEALGEWEKAEIARIRRETEEGINARHGHLEAELSDQTARLDAELERVQRQVAAYQAEMDGFFQQLLQEDDPSHFASVAEQLPEPPTFEPWSGELGATAAVTGESTDAASSTEMDAGDAGGGDDETSVGASDAPVTEASAPDDAVAAQDPGAGMPEMQPDDFAAAEAEAEQWVDAGEAPSADGVDGAEPETADPRDQTGPGASASAVADPGATRTQVAVSGLGSVASIATFKRLLGRVPGVRGVQVASGPDGEFLFNASHDDGLDVPAAIMSIQGFEIEILASGPGVVSARTLDPEVI